MRYIVLIIIIINTMVFLTGCNKTSVSDRGANGVLGQPQPSCHFVCTDKGEDDNKIVCQQCDDNSMAFCAELDDSQANVYCNRNLTKSKRGRHAGQ